MSRESFEMISIQKRLQKGFGLSVCIAVVAFEFHWQIFALVLCPRLRLLLPLFLVTAFLLKLLFIILFFSIYEAQAYFLR